MWHGIFSNVKNVRSKEVMNHMNWCEIREWRWIVRWFVTTSSVDRDVGGDWLKTVGAAFLNCWVTAQEWAAEPFRLARNFVSQEGILKDCWAESLNARNAKLPRVHQQQQQGGHWRIWWPVNSDLGHLGEVQPFQKIQRREQSEKKDPRIHPKDAR